jgi:spoIIIJ-associated protein
VNVHEEALDALRRAEQFEQFDSAAPGAAANAYDDTDALEAADAAEAGGEERPDEAFEPITAEQGEEAAAVLREMIAKMGIEAEVSFLHTEDGAAKLDVRSQDSAMLIGRKGRTLGAIQYLVNRMVAQGDTAENTERLMVDVEGYVDRRRESLEDLARHFAGRVKDSGRPARLKPLSPQERRIIHMTLRNDPEVRTASLGEALYRTVVISPINARPGRSQGQGGGGGRGRGSRGGRGRGGGGRRPDGPPRQRDAEIDPGQFGD